MGYWLPFLDDRWKLSQSAFVRYEQMAQVQGFRVDDGGRECTTCREYKSWDNYTSMKRGAYGRGARCKECTATANKIKRGPNKPKPYDEHGRHCTTCKEYKTWDHFSADKGHSTGYAVSCRVCKNEKFKTWHAANPELDREIRLKRYLANVDDIRADARQRMAEVRKALGNEAYNAKARAYRQANYDKWYAAHKARVGPRKQELYEYNRKHRQLNPHKYAAYDATKRAKRKLRYVEWADLAKIQTIYERAAMLTRLTGVDHHVDHYYPLLGDTVSGLHVPENLAVIPAIENARKGNKHPEEFYQQELTEA